MACAFLMLLLVKHISLSCCFKDSNNCCSWEGDFCGKDAQCHRESNLKTKRVIRKVCKSKKHIILVYYTIHFVNNNKYKPFLSVFYYLRISLSESKSNAFSVAEQYFHTSVFTIT